MKAKTSFFCTECGNEYAKWQGRCPACGSWNTLVEQQTVTGSKKAQVQRKTVNRAVPLRELSSDEEIRFTTGIKELDRVLGGGAVKGSLVLVGGAPGVGKSTLLLQICGELSSMGVVLYVTGEESCRQLKMRADRLCTAYDGIFVISETNLQTILDTVDETNPEFLIIDSIQTIFNEELTSAPGSVGQVKDCTMALMRLDKNRGITVFVIGHVNKEGAIAGPKVLEHMVDCVLYFEGSVASGYRILRAAKNRYGSTNEIGVFEMLDNGLCSVDNPSELLLSGRPEGTPGTCVACVIEGSRPILAEVQALLCPTSFNAARRNSNGVDYNRAMLLLAVAEKIGGLRIGACDAYINVIGGLELDEPAADLAIVIAVASSYLDKPVDGNLAAIGEIGLTGELRAVSNLSQRLSETARLGFTKCVIPRQGRGKVQAPAGMELIQVSNIGEAMNAVFGR
ncbi:MAG: DNA repair protein RadA [Oscillospiraceae bacterium]|nr:DNA repair protein RadA [Oscillospiraceae bacterium]